jgi:integrase
VLREGRSSHAFSKWFNEKPRRANAEVAIPDFHSLRHTVRTTMTAARVSEQHQDKITGHETHGSIGNTVYANHVAMAQLKDAIETIRYEDFNLPRSYKV